MERLVFDLESVAAPGARRAPVVVGVVASGNLEVLVEPGKRGRCHVEIATSANGFGEIWEAVLRDFAARRPVAGLAVSVNDAGATPAVVTLRLDQAVEEYLGQVP
ncbi:MAG TPA: malonate decarboxylase acyl carrier protein [Anaeromyxobacter sp.]